MTKEIQKSTIYGHADRLTALPNMYTRSLAHVAVIQEHVGIKLKRVFHVGNARQRFSKHGVVMPRKSMGVLVNMVHSGGICVMEMIEIDVRSHHVSELGWIVGRRRSVHNNCFIVEVTQERARGGANTKVTPVDLFYWH